MQQGMMGQYGNPAAAMPVGGNFGGFPMTPGGVQPAGYYSQAPAYWYPR